MASCWGWKSEETGWLVLNGLVITRQEEKGQQKEQDPPSFQILSAAANAAHLSPMLMKVSFYSLCDTSIMQIPTF